MAYDPSPLDTSPTTIQTIKAGGDKINENFTELPNMLDAKVDKVIGKQLSTEDYTTAEKDKLAGIEAGATANATDAQLRDRSSHTGTQDVTTITGLGSSATADIGTNTGEVIGTAEAKEYFGLNFEPSIQPTITSNFSRNKHERYEVYGNEPKTLLQQWDVNRNSTATYFDANGVLQTAAVNQPRIDYSTGKALLLVEGQSTNLIPNSTNYAAASWNKNLGTNAWQGSGSAPVITPNAAIAPNGLNEAYQIDLALNGGLSSSDRSGFFYSVASVNNGTEYYTRSYLKPINPISIVDLANIVQVSSLAAGTNPTEIIINPLKDGWYEVIKRYVPSTTTGTFRYQITGVDGFDSVSFYLWHSELVNQSRVESPIFTGASAVTRVADIITPKGDA